MKIGSAQLGALVLVAAALAAGTAGAANPAAPVVRDVHAQAWPALKEASAAGRWAALDSLASSLVATIEGESPADSLALSRALIYVAQARYMQRLVNDDRVFAAIERSLAIRSRHAKADDPLYAWSHLWASKFYLDLGRGEDGLRHARETLRLHAAQVPPDSMQISEDHLTIGLALHAVGRDQEARASFQRAVEVREARVGPDHEAMVPVLAEYGQWLSDLGEFDEARARLDRARTIAEGITDPRSDRLEGVLARQTTLELRVGNLAESVELAQRSYEIAAAQAGEDALRTLRARTRVAYRLAEFGDHAAAVAQLRGLLPRLTQDLGPEHPTVINARLSCLQSSVAIGDTSGVRAELAGLAPMVESPTGAMDANAMYLALMAAQMQQLAGDAPGARARLEAAVDRAWPHKQALAEHIAAACTQGLGTLKGRADRPAAQRLRARLDALHDSTSVGATPEWIAVLSARAAAEARVGRAAAAWDDALLASRAERDRLRYQAQALPDRRALQLADQLTGACDVLVQLARDGKPAQVRQAWEAIVRSRGLVRAEIASRRLAAAAAADPGVVAAHARWLGAQRRLAQLVVSGAAHPEDPDSAARFEAGRRESDDAERGFMRLLGSAAPDTVSLARILSRLRPGQALVAFAPADIGKGDIGTGDRTLGAFVARAGSKSLRYVALGREADLAADIADWASAMATPPPTSPVAAADAERRCRTLGDIVRKRLWDPVHRAAGSANELFLVPEGAIWNVSWLALPGRGNGYLADEGRIVRVLNAERELLGDDAPAGRGLLAMGGPDFDLDRTAASRSARTPTAAADRSWPCVSGRAGPLGPLPAARAEAEAIAGIWDTSTSMGARALFVGAASDERTFKLEAPGKAVIHLATHGIVLRDTCEVAVSDLRGVGGVSSLERRPGKSTGSSSRQGSAVTWLGHRVWLAMAGANRPAGTVADENEGLLTSEEVSTLDLAGTDWVVLSACHSGVGEAWAREGQLGMRRAFHLAGARTVIASGWAVADEATREWMLGLYAARLRNLPAGAAVREASRMTLEQRRRDGRSTHPFYWAGFAAVGE
ncbi:MAG: CHAT domain-containing protein [bacterium]|nr:CHAT domain-containing protein [bacterium]